MNLVEGSSKMEWSEETIKSSSLRFSERTPWWKGERCNENKKGGVILSSAREGGECDFSFICLRESEIVFLSFVGIIRSKNPLPYLKDPFA